MSGAPPIRILAIHGMRMSADMLREMTADLRSQLGEQARWHFVESPTPATGPPFPVIGDRWPGGPFYEWWNAVDREDGGVDYVGFDAGFAHICETLRREGPFDVLAGYSQGAIFATILTALREAGDPRLADLSWRCVALFNSGPPPRLPAAQARLNAGPLTTPSLHVLGGPTDLTYEAQHAMVECWSADTRRVFEHEEGHQPPTLERSALCVGEVAAALREVGATLR